MNEYDEYDMVYYCDDIPYTGASVHRKPSRYEMDTMTPAEIDAYIHNEEWRYQE